MFSFVNERTGIAVKDYSKQLTVSLDIILTIEWRTFLRKVLTSDKIYVVYFQIVNHSRTFLQIHYGLY